MSDQPFARMDELPLSGKVRVDEICARFEAAWKAGQRPSIEQYLAVTPEAECPAHLGELLFLELFYRRLHGETPALEDYQHRFPAQAVLIAGVFREADGRARPLTANSSRVSEIEGDLHHGQ
jgi:eukaryotic-like serine/threonine-protein kinase